MKLIIALYFVAIVAAAPPTDIKSEDNDVKLLQYDSKIDEDGNYSFSYVQTDGQKRKEEGQVKNAGLENQTVVVKGSYTWIDADGVSYNVIYVADENGYKPEIIKVILGGSVSPQIASMLG